MKHIALILVVGLILFSIISCERWKYNECKKVGHGAAYCIWKMGR